MSSRAHWEAVYVSREPEDVSWYQANPQVSVDLVHSTGAGPSSRVLDVGGGASVFVDRLIASGFRRIGVLDISPSALHASKRRLGLVADEIEWIEGDVLRYEAGHPWDVWHDRAVFHFLVDPLDRVRYREVLYRTVPPGGHVILATFGPNGPSRCSGLATANYSAQGIAVELGAGVRLLEERTEAHATPAGVVQEFVYARLVRVDVRGRH